MATSKMTRVKTNSESPATVEEVIEARRHKDYILCRSIIAGGLHVSCKSGNSYEFKGYGSDCEIEYHDLATLVRKHSAHVFNPRFIIKDEDFLAEFPQIQKAYDDMYTVNDLKDILDLPVSQMLDEMKRVPDTLKDTLKNLAASQIENGTIDSVRKIRALSEFFGADFNFLSELFSR